MRQFDLVVVGGGTGNNVASSAARSGMDVALVEKGPLGGTCLTRGCDPSKSLVHRADLLEQIRRAGEFGIDVDLRDVDFSKIVAESNDPFDEKAEGMKESMRETDDLTLYDVEARFVDERTLEVGDERIEGERVVVAVGARPLVPDSIEGVRDVDYVTSAEVMRLGTLPDRLIIAGGGYIAAEMGHVFGALGADVTIVGRSDWLLPRQDRDVRETFTEAFERRYDVRTGTEVTAVSQDGGTFTVEVEGDDGPGEVTGDQFLLATGRRPNSDLLEVENAGIETDDGGFVEVDEHFETSAENVWAFGDVVGNYMFWHSAMEEAECVYRNAVHGESREVDYEGMAHAVFSSPQVASTGRTEQELEEEGREYVVGRYDYGDAAMGIAMKEEDGFAKVLADPDDGEVLGCHIVGPDASTLIHEVVTAVSSGSGTVSDVADAIHIHPALNEVVQRAFDDV